MIISAAKHKTSEITDPKTKISEKTQITFKVGQIFYISSLLEEKSSIVARLVNYSSFKAKYNRTIVEIYLKLKPHPPLGKKSSSVVDPKSPVSPTDHEISVIGEVTGQVQRRRVGVSEGEEKEEKNGVPSGGTL